MSTSTPGPWVAVILGGGKGGPNEYSIRVADMEAGAHAIARVHARQGQPAGANAHLIAAAPDSLAALQRALAWCCAAGMDGTGDAVEPEWCEQARAAIAKAEGKLLKFEAGPVHPGKFSMHDPDNS